MAHPRTHKPGMPYLESIMALSPSFHLTHVESIYTLRALVLRERNTAPREHIYSSWALLSRTGGNALCVAFPSVYEETELREHIYSSWAFSPLFRLTHLESIYTRGGLCASGPQKEMHSVWLSPYAPGREYRSSRAYILFAGFALPHKRKCTLRGLPLRPRGNQTSRAYRLCVALRSGQGIPDLQSIYTLSGSSDPSRTLRECRTSRAYIPCLASSPTRQITLGHRAYPRSTFRLRLVHQEYIPLEWGGDASRRSANWGVSSFCTLAAEEAVLRDSPCCFFPDG